VSAFTLLLFLFNASEDRKEETRAWIDCSLQDRIFIEANSNGYAAGKELNL
jgi:hypothetical protein